MLIKVFCVLSMLNKLPPRVCWRGGGATGLLNKGGGEQQASWFSKQQAVEFPQVLTSNNNCDGVSEASGATLTDYVDGAWNICMYVCIHVLYSWGELLHVRAELVPNQHFWNLFLLGKEIWKSWLWSWFESGPGAWETSVFTTETCSGALAALNIKLGSYIQRPWLTYRTSGENQKRLNTCITRYTCL